VADNQIAYNLFNKASSLQLIQDSQSISSYEITYGPDDQRRKSYEYSAVGGINTTTIYSGLFEERSNGDRLYHINSPAGIAALVVTNNTIRAREIFIIFTTITKVL
jgi:hypothetical protein